MASIPGNPSLRPRSLLSVAKKQLVVTGGAGFIGSHLVAALNQGGEDNIIIVDRLGSGMKWRNLEGLRFDDLVGVDEFRERVRQSGIPAGSTVFHLGASDRPTHRDAESLVDNIFRCSREIAEACARTGARMIYTSSAATYGAGEAGCFDSDTTTRQLRPQSPYGFAKHMFDLWALRSGHLARFAGLKPFNVYGPREDHKGEMRSLVTRACEEILETGQATLFKSHRADCADGEQARDFVHVKDVISMILHFYDHPECAGLFNCGTGKASTANEVVRAVFAAMDREPKIVFVDMPEALRASFQYFTQAEMTRAQTVDVSIAFTPLHDGVRTYVQEYLQPRASGGPTSSV